VKEKINSLFIPYLPTASYIDRTDGINGLFLAIEPHPLAYEPWLGRDTKPKVEFKMAYGDDAVFLKFLVREKHFRATFKQINDPVWNDSCVEFFIGFEDDGAYYNFEFNALGTPVVGYGIDKEREIPDAELIKKIKCIPDNNIAGNDTFPFNWELTVVIPFILFYKHRVTTLKGINCRGNFYKCGDKLPEPHFLCWNNIIADTPNFHLPQYFGKLIFQ